MAEQVGQSETWGGGTPLNTGSGGVLMTAQARGFAQSLPGACPHCSSPFSATFHTGPCPRVKAIEYHPNGRVKRVEFKEANRA